MTHIQRAKNNQWDIMPKSLGVAISVCAIPMGASGSTGECRKTRHVHSTARFTNRQPSSQLSSLCVPDMMARQGGFRWFSRKILGVNNQISSRETSLHVRLLAGVRPTQVRVVPCQIVDLHHPWLQLRHSHGILCYWSSGCKCPLCKTIANVGPSNYEQWS